MKRKTSLLFGQIVSATATIIAILLTAQPARSQQSSQQLYTIGDYPGGAWTSDVGITGFGISNPNTSGSVGQTFLIHNVNVALVDSISVPIYWYANTSPQVQIGISAWSGSHPVGPAMYLSDPITGNGGNNGNWQTVTLSPNNLVLNLGQEYVLFLTPNAFVNSSPAYNNMLGYVPASGYADGQYYDLVGYEYGLNDLYDHSWTAANANIAFSITYQPVPTPEPAAPILLCLGGVALWWFKRMRS